MSRIGRNALKRSEIFSSHVAPRTSNEEKDIFEEILVPVSVWDLN